MREPLNADLLQHLTTAVIVTDADGRVRWLNQAAEALLGISGARTLGEPVRRLLGLGRDGGAGDGAAEPNDGVAQALGGRRALTERAAGIVTPAGGRAVDLTVTPLDAGGGALIEIVPLTPLMQSSRDEARVAAEENVRLLVRGLGHEIKNPLGGLRGAAQLLERELPDPALKEYTRVIIEEADRLRELVDRLMSPAQHLRRDRLSVHRVLERVIHLIAAEAPDIGIERDYDPSLPDIQGDEGQLTQAFLNVLRNAQQALSECGTPDGERPLIRVRSRIVRQVTLGLRRHRLAVRVDVVDNGPGVPASLRERLFLPMVSGRAGGSGLGLSITRGIVMRHEGTITCSSEPGCTCITLTLPVAAA
jgi:two-component system nitrogen regulation sensor histidine kinase GlnL